MPDKGPRLRDVAQRAGVSLGTASNVLSQKVAVAPETRERVLRAVEELGYRWKSHARPAHRPQASGPLAVIGAVGKISGTEFMTSNPFYSHILTGIERECRRQHISLMLAHIATDAYSRPVSLPPMLLDDHVDAVIIVGTFLENTIHMIGDRFDKPVALVEAYSPGNRFDSVLIDNEAGAARAVDHLVALGHRHIGLIGSTPDAYPSIRERRRGFQAALHAHGISAHYIIDSLLDREESYRATLELLHRSPRVSAIFACNDDVAMGVYRAAAELGRQIPRDLSVVGFDNIDLAAQCVPPLTTLHVDKQLLGTMAVRHLVDRAENPSRPTLTTSVSTELVQRSSTAPPARARRQGGD